MELWKKIGKALLLPHIAVPVILTPFSAVLLAYSFIFCKESDVISIVAYVVSAYTLTVICFRIPDMIRFAKRIKNENKYVVRYRNDVPLRIGISLYSSLAMNSAYAIFQLCLGIYHSTVWYYSFAVYYAILAVVRFFLLKDVRSARPERNYASELKRYRFCGIILIPMNLALAVIVFYIAWQGRGFVHHPITTIAMAAYTFCTLTLAIINVIKYRKYQNPVFSAAKVISLVSASVSMLTLETAMLTAFNDGQTGEGFRFIMTSATGSAVCVFIIVMALFMILTANRGLRSIKEKACGGKEDE